MSRPKLKLFQKGANKIHIILLVELEEVKLLTNICYYKCHAWTHHAGTVEAD